MKLHWIAIGFVNFALACGTALACVCPPGPETVGVSKWVLNSTNAATFVFLARVTEVTESKEIPALGVIAKVKVIDSFKGIPRFVSLSISECQDFALKKDDVRVFFVASDGMIHGCSEYRAYITDEQLVNVLREQKRNAN